MRKSARTRWLLGTTAITVVAFVLGGVSAHLMARRHGWHPNYGDVPTWLAAIIGTVAAAIALAQLWLLNQSQRQLNEVEIRKQAQMVELEFVQNLYGSAVIAIKNHSARPLRNVDARLTKEGAVADQRPQEYGVPSQGARYMSEHADRLETLPAGREGHIKFQADLLQHGVLVRFTDDAGHTWEMDEDLNLQRAPSRPRW